VLCILHTNTHRGGLRHDIIRVQAQTTAWQEIMDQVNGSLFSDICYFHDTMKLCDPWTH